MEAPRLHDRRALRLLDPRVCDATAGASRATRLPRGQPLVARPPFSRASTRVSSSSTAWLPPKARRQDVLRSPSRAAILTASLQGELPDLTNLPGSLPRRHAPGEGLYSSN